jgi:biopolymer transport protein TolR
MAMSAGADSGGVKSDINVTPLVDVVLVLLIIFMVITPMIRSGVQVTLPIAKNTRETSEDPSKRIVVTIKGDKTLYLNNEPINKDGLRPSLDNIYRNRRGEYIVLKSDKNLTYGDVIEIMGICRGVGAPGVDLVTDKPKKK